MRNFQSNNIPDKQKLQKIIDEEIQKEEEFYIPKRVYKNKDPSEIKENIDDESEIQRIQNLQIIQQKVKMRNDIDQIDQGEKSVHDPDDESLPLQIRERRQVSSIHGTFKEKAQWGEFYRVYGIVLFLLGSYFLTIPFYNVLCQKFGFTMRQSHKSYLFKDDEINVFRKFKVNFLCHTQDEIPWEFQPSTPTIIVNAGETALSFYKVYNRANRPIAGIAIYQIYPEDAAIYFNKIQCFCFENQLLYPNESLELPLLFYLDPAINHDPSLADAKEIFLTYNFFPSADQTLAEILQVEIEKHQKEEQELAKKKRELIQNGVKGIDESKNHGVIAQGYNPKDKPEMFIKKIQQNQKRIQNTINQYVLEHKLETQNQQQQQKIQDENIQDNVFNPNQKISLKEAAS